MLRSIPKSLLAVALVGTMVAVPAFAQQPASYPPPCDASKVSKGDVDRAHTVFLSGKQFLDESNYDKAISYFSDAYSIDCSVHAILPIIATAYERKGDKAEAVRALEEYLRRVPASPDRERVERRVKNLNDQLSREQPSASAAPAPGTGAPLPSASASAAPAPTSSASAAPPLPPPLATSDETSSSSRGTGPWILTGIGGAATIGGIVFYAIGSGDITSAESACNGGRSGCPDAVASKGNRGRTFETVGAVVGVAGIATLGAGLVWLFTQKPEVTPASRAFVSPVVAPGYAGIAFGSPL